MSKGPGLALRRNLEGPIDFSDMSGGVVTTYPANAIEDNQVADCLNALFEKRGFSKWPGYAGISAAALFAAPIRGEFVFKKADGTEAYIVVSNKVIYSFSITAGTATALLSITSDNECYAVNYFGKLWIVNGVDMVKIESTLTAYRIGIVAPAGFSLGGATAIAGTLPAGAYDVYVTYTRQISGVNVLDSAPFHAGTVTVDGSHGIRVVTVASTDPQVTHITAWITDAGDTSTYYYFGTTANATGNFDIANNTNKNASLLLYEQAASNQVPVGLSYVYAFSGRLWACKASDNTLYYTQLAQNVYDLEKWATQYYIPTIPFTILSVHGIGADLFCNTAGGMYKLPSADVTAKPEPVTQGAITNTQLFNFPKNNIKSVAEYNDGIMGITNDGFRVFDGTTFSGDLSKNIKPQIDIMMQNAANFPPSAIIYRRSGKRTEYQVSYNDSSISTSCHNRKLVLNVDKVVFQNYFNKDYVTESDKFNAPWEFVQGGFSHAIVTSSNQLIVAQFTSSAGVIAQETGTTDNLCLDETGAFVSKPTPRKIYVRTKTLITELAGSDTWKRIYTLATLSNACTMRLFIPDRFQYMTSFMFQATGGANPPILDSTPPLVLDDPAALFILPADNPLSMFDKMPINARGNAMYLELEQVAEDSKFFVFEIQAYGYHEKNNFN